LSCGVGEGDDCHVHAIGGTTNVMCIGGTPRMSCAVGEYDECHAGTGEPGMSYQYSRGVRRLSSPYVHLNSHVS